MSVAVARRQPSLAVLVNAVVLLVLALAAGWLLAWQWPALRWDRPSSMRWLQAGGCVVAWLLLCLWSWARQQRLQHRSARLEQVGASHANTLPPDWLVVHASQTGHAEQLAWQTATTLDAAGAAVRVAPLAALDTRALARGARLLFVASTTGEGDAPDAAAGFVRERMRTAASLAGLRYGLLALGDRNYANFCGFGRQLDCWLREGGATQLFDPVEVDNGAPDALRHWQHQLAVLTGASELPDWQAPRYRPWRLVERRLLNPGCEGGPCFHLALQALDPADAVWQAGDIAEIGPRNPPDQVRSLLDALRLDGECMVGRPGDTETLSERLARCHLPEAAEIECMDAAALAAVLQPLPHREYSIASLPCDGSLQLLVRQLRRPDGRLGLGGGWLSLHAPLGSSIDLRIRRNVNFHPPPDARPLVLVGNGTGMAGLRALIKARVAAGHRDNWLLFGERHAAHDIHYRDEIEVWREQGFLTRVDLAFSRDPPARVYVQDRLRESSSRLRAWVEAGAAIHVCGSLQGMAGGVDAVLTKVLGAQALECLGAEGRYRRDVY